MNRKELVIWLILLLNAVAVTAQITPVVSSDKEKIFIGEPLKLTLELKAIERNAAIRWVIPDSIPHFEYISYDTADLLKREITISSYDSGSWSIDNIAVVVPSNMNDKPQLLKFPSKVISVEYDTTGNRLMNDVKPIIEVNSLQSWIGYLIAALALLSLIVLMILFRKWKQKKIQQIEKDNLLPPLEDFQRTVEKLKKMDWSDQLQQKQNFTELSQAVKKYFERKIHQPFSKLTTDEFVLDMKPYLSNEQSITLAQVSRLADAVKFARFFAAEQDCMNALNEATSIITQTDKQLTNDV
ncbi:MAG: hypothetical protein QM725_16385 [Lacibacter sp.]